MQDREYLFALEQFGIKLGLDQIRGLVAALGHPDRAFRSIVIAGTNGKGSVTAMVERGLRAAGYRTGRYTSPHLVHLEERFAIDGRDVAPGDVDAAAGRTRMAAAGLPFPPSFFEATTAMALDLFARAAVDIAVLEVGLGGRLDAVNVVASIAEAITAIDFDHQQYLGHTLKAIAAEKAGVIKPGSLVVVGANPAEVRRVIADRSARVGADAVFAPEGVTAQPQLIDGITHLDLRTPRHEFGGVKLALRGRHQIDNAITAARLLEEVAARTTLVVPEAAIRTALSDVAWPGRLEMIAWRGADILLDGAHNPAGARALASYLDETYARPIPLVLGAMRDKDLDGLVAPLVAVASHVVCTAASTPRATPPADLAEIVRRLAPHVPVFDAADSRQALDLARPLDRVIAVAGSLYLVGEVRAGLT